MTASASAPVRINQHQSVAHVNVYAADPDYDTHLTTHVGVQPCNLGRANTIVVLPIITKNERTAEFRSRI